MTNLLDKPPFAPRDDVGFLTGMNEICSWHLAGCPEYRLVWPDWSEARQLEDLPFLHVGVFKRRLWKTMAPGIMHQRTLRSSSTTQATASMIALDERSSALQARSSGAILKRAGRRVVAATGNPRPLARAPATRGSLGANYGGHESSVPGFGNSFPPRRR